MSDLIRVFIADSDINRTNALIEYASSANSEIAVVGHCSDGNRAYSMIKQSNPDVVIISLLLTETDGLSLIENIHNSLPSIPKIICISPVSNDFIVKHVFNSGVSYFMLSPVDVSVIVQRIEDVCRPDASLNSVQHPGEMLYSHYTEETVKTLLLELGIPANLKGYLYLSYAIELLIDREDTSFGVVKGLYPIIASKFNSTVSRVERSIRHAIDVAWCRGKIGNMNEIFGINLYKEYEKPTSREFISLIADRIILMKKSGKT